MKEKKGERKILPDQEFCQLNDSYSDFSISGRCKLSLCHLSDQVIANSEVVCAVVCEIFL